ncbi:MAG: hypothetical protein EOP04_24305, partial [Proteobacteria bacterium]
MKRLAILSLIAAPAYAHQIAPETKFFKKELERNPLTTEVLAWCNLVGITDENVCKGEMYEKSGHISEQKIAAAKICVEKSGLKYRIAFDQFFKVDAKRNALVSHQSGGTVWHTHYVTDPNEGANAKAHRHFYTETDKIEASRLMGNQFVDQFIKERSKPIVTETSETHGTGSVTLG